MKDLSTAKSIAEENGTASSVKSKMTGGKTILGATAVVVLVGATKFFSNWMMQPSSTQAAEAARSQAPAVQRCVETPVETQATHGPVRLTLRAGKSEAVAIGPGQHIEANGINYVLRTEFEMGCNGPRVVRGVFANTTGETAYVDYELKPN